MDTQIDQHRFEELTTMYRHELRVHCYRMLGSLQESEDLIQETMLRAWRHLHTYRGPGTFKGWLYKIATNACLDALKKRKKRELVTIPIPDGSPLHSEPFLPRERILVEPIPTSWIQNAIANPESQYLVQESIRIAFIVALQKLTPNQRAILILCDVLGWRAKEAANLFEISRSAVSSSLHRARENMRKGNVEMIGLSNNSPDGTDAQLLDQFVNAWESANINDLITLLSDGVAFTMPPASNWFKGLQSVRILLTTVLFAHKGPNLWRLLPTSANNQPSFGMYLRDPVTGNYQPHALQVLTIEGKKLVAATHFLYPHYLPHFGLPEFINGR